MCQATRAYDKSRLVPMRAVRASFVKGLMQWAGRSSERIESGLNC